MRIELLPAIMLVAGFFIGSFLNVVVDRVPFKKSIIKGRSHCEQCKRDLGIKDLIPIFSYFFQRGKCRYCHTHLSLYYPIVEITTGIIYFITTLFLLSQNSLLFINYFIFYIFIASCLIIVFFSDLKYGIILDKVLIPAVVITIVFNVLISQQLMLNNFFSALGSFAFFFLLFLGTKGRGMGFGDVKFAFLMGFLLGFPNIIVGLYIAFLTGALVSIILILWRGKLFLKKTIPFGPFLALSTFITLLWGNLIWERVVSLLF